MRMRYWKHRVCAVALEAKEDRRVVEVSEVSDISVSNLALKSRDFKMTRGNQRELARQKNQKKNTELVKKKGANDKTGNKGLSLETRKQRDADVMREKQKKALDKDGNQDKGEKSN